MRLTAGGWTRQVTVRELGIAKAIAGVNMRLNAGGVRELHWHKAAEWAYVLTGTARITAVDADGRNFVDDVGVGDLWYFPPGIPHSIQGLDPDGTRILAGVRRRRLRRGRHLPPERLHKTHAPGGARQEFRRSASSFASVPNPSELYIFPAPVPGPLSADKIAGAVEVPQSFSHRMMAQAPIKTKNGTARITDSKVFPASKTIAAALVEVEPGGMRELHWHPNSDEWQYYIEGRRAWACSGRPARPAHSISRPMMSATYHSRWGTPSKTRATRR